MPSTLWFLTVWHARVTSATSDGQLSFPPQEWVLNKYFNKDGLTERCELSHLTVMYLFQTANPLVSALDPNQLIIYSLYRDSTKYINGHHIKVQ